MINQLHSKLTKLNTQLRLSSSVANPMSEKSLTTEHSTTAQDSKNLSFIRWNWSTNAKDIGSIYLAIAVAWGSIGVALSDAIRIQLLVPGSNFLGGNGQLYNSIISAHALAMIFFFVMPVFIGALANYLVPMMLGTADMAYPRLNNISLWLLVPASSLIILGMLVEKGAGTG
jgi:heme/copper-type cytochrome/quinol oxidase subunit 1